MSEIQSSSQLCDFQICKGTDHAGRYLEDIWAFDDKAIEQTHDFIQWMFPLTEKSLSVPGVPTLSATDIEAICTSNVARANLEQSANWYLGFLKRNNHWIKPYDHNHLRITRVIKSVRLLTGNLIADAAKEKIFIILGERISVIQPKAVTFWNLA